jgi:chemotaxis signal transduction protein
MHDTDLKPDAPMSAANRELISFRIDEQEFCVDIMVVREIRGWTPATPLWRRSAARWSGCWWTPCRTS